MFEVLDRLRERSVSTNQPVHTVSNSHITWKWSSLLHSVMAGSAEEPQTMKLHGLNRILTLFAVDLPQYPHTQGTKERNGSDPKK